MEQHYFECDCHSDEHRLVFTIDDGKWACSQFGPDKPEVWAGIFLHQYRNIFKRIWIAIKYILGYKCKYGHFDCFVLRTEDIPRFKEMLTKVQELEAEWADKIVSKSEQE